MNGFKRIVSFIVIAAAVLGVCSAALALTETDFAAIAPASSFTAVNGEVEFQLNITKSGASTAEEAVITGMTPGSGGIIAAVTEITALTNCTSNLDGSVTIAADVPSAWIKVKALLASNASSGKAKLNVFVNSLANPIVSGDISITVPGAGTGSDTGSGDATTDRSYVRLSPIDAYGNVVPAASGNYGDRIRLRIPLVSDFYTIGGLKISPVITTDVETFPFDLTLVDYTAAWPGYLRAGEIAEFTYDFTLSKKITAGVKKVDFKVVFTDPYNNLMEGTVSVYINVKRGATPPSTGTETPDTSTKLIVEPVIKPTSDDGKVYAGEEFNVDYSIRNITSSSVKNVIIKLNDTTGVVSPTNSGSTIYIESISGGDSKTVTVPLKAANDAEPKAYTLTASVSYDGSATPSEQNVTIPVAQRIRLKFDNPVIYDEGWVGSPVAMYLAMYNLGKSSIYNCMVAVEGDGLAIEETYFGGNVSPGGTMRADFNVIPSVGGDIKGNVIITYEDAVGASYEEKLPFDLFVNENIPMEDPMMGEDGMMMGEDGMMGGDMSDGGSGGASKWWWALTALPVGGGGFFLVKALKKKRQRELMDIEESDV